MKIPERDSSGRVRLPACKGHDISRIPEAKKRATMTRTITIAGVTLLLLMVSAVQVASADGAAQKNDLQSVYISSVTMNPGVLYPYESGTVSVTVSNAGNTSIGISNPDIVSDDLQVVRKDTWQTMSYIVSGSSITYDFVVSAIHPDGDGSYFAMFTIETVNGATVHYPFVVKVDSDDLTASISKKPDAFPLSADKDVNLTIINPREGSLDNILVTASGDNAGVTPSQKFVGTLDAQSSVDVPFTVTAHGDTNVKFHITYQSGDTVHSTDVTLPVNVGNDKTAAVPTVNNIALKTGGDSYDLSGDIANTGISDAKGLVVSVGSPAKGTGTYPEYAVGSLASDDSSSFEVTFTSPGGTTIPLVFHWKDADGNDYSVTKTLELSSYSSTGSTGLAGGSSNASGSSRPAGTGSMSSGPGGMGSAPGDMNGGPGALSGGPGGSSSSGNVLSSITSAKGGLSSFYPVIAMFVLIIAGVVAYTRRKWILSAIRKK